MKRIALICLLGLCLQVTAQKNYQKGLVVLTNGDTLKGWIDYRNWHVNPTAIKFKQDSLADNSRQFTTADISFFQVAGDKYQKAFIKKDMLPVDIDHLVADSTGNQQTDTAFLRVLVEGPVLNLYEVYDFKPHYYIQDSTKSYRELTYRCTIGEPGHMVFNNSFRDELRAYLPQQPPYDKKLASRIENISYNDKEIRKVVAGLNGLTGKSISYVSNNSKKALSFYAGGGAMYSTMTFSGDDAYLKGMDFGWKTSPVIMAGVELFSERSFRQLSFRLEVAYNSVGYEANNVVTKSSSGTDSVHYDIKLRNIIPSATVLYHIVRKENFRYYIGAQFAVNLSNSTNVLAVRHQAIQSYSYSSSPYLSFNKNWPIINIKTGAIINRRWDVGITGSVWGSNVSTTQVHNKITQYALWLGYHFI